MNGRKEPQIIIKRSSLIKGENIFKLQFTSKKDQSKYKKLYTYNNATFSLSCATFSFSSIYSICTKFY